MSRSGNANRAVLASALGLLLACAGFFLAAAAPAQAQALPTRHVRPQVATGESIRLDRLPAARIMRLDIALPLRNQGELDELLELLYDDSNSPFYHQFLSVEQFTERFGPTEADYAAVLDFVRRKGLEVTATSPNRLVVSVSGSVASVERAFRTTISAYQDPASGRIFYSADSEPLPDLAVPLWHITGLDNLSDPHPASLLRAAQPNAVFRAISSGPSGNYIGSDLRAAYYGSGPLTGAGQSIGLLEFAGYNIADVNAYFAAVGQPLNVPVNGVSTDGSSLACNSGCTDTEQVLDIETAISMAPALSQVLVYVSDTSDISMLNRMATDNLAKSLSSSWNWSPADPASDDPIFKEFAAQGQSFFVSSGDNGSYGQSTQSVYPADDANVTAVGGTDLATTKAGGTWKSETAWAHSGGGISPDSIAIPSYQKTLGVISTANLGSKTLRNIPDVAAEADTDNYICYDGTCAGGWGGTSFAAPRWAAFIALADQQAAANGLATLGFLNPELYSIGLGRSRADFHDITSGSNGGYSAVAGYDLVTGWGSPNGASLINTLVP